MMKGITSTINPTVKSKFYDIDTDLFWFCIIFRFLACSKDETTNKWSGKVLDCPKDTFYEKNIRVCVPPVIYKCDKPIVPPAPWMKFPRQKKRQ